MADEKHRRLRIRAGTEARFFPEAKCCRERTRTLATGGIAGTKEHAMAGDWAKKLGEQFRTPVSEALPKRPETPEDDDARQAFYGMAYPKFKESIQATVLQVVNEYNAGAGAEVLKLDAKGNDVTIFRAFPPRASVEVSLDTTKHILTIRRNEGMDEDTNKYAIKIVEQNLGLFDLANAPVTLDDRLETAFVSTFQLD